MPASEAEGQHLGVSPEVVSRGSAANLCQAEDSKCCGARCKVDHARWEAARRIYIRPNLPLMGEGQRPITATIHDLGLRYLAADSS